MVAWMRGNSAVKRHFGCANLALCAWTDSKTTGKNKSNRPLPSSKNSYVQNEAKCKYFLVKMSFISSKNLYQILIGESMYWKLSVKLTLMPRDVTKAGWTLFWQFVSICQLPNHNKRKVAAHKLKLGEWKTRKWKIYWWNILIDR